MLKTYLDTLLKFHHKKHGGVSKTVSLSIGAIFFLIILPGFFYYLASLMNFRFDTAAVIKIPISLFAVGIGLFFLFWATFSQLKIGGGTPAPNAPTRNLVILGPYKYTRNPIQFGAMWYYFGFGALLGTLYHGIACMLLGLFIGSIYHKFIEEKELLLRFGKEYADYRDTTPFLLPRFWSKKN